MIEVKYKERLGNNLFQYCLGRILAKEKGYALKADQIKGFFGTYEKIDGSNYEQSENILTLTGNKIDFNKALAAKPPCHIILDGFFQRYEYYKAYKSQIKEWLRFENKFPKNTEDILLHIRRGDYVKIGWALPREYYEEALSKTTYKRVIIATDDPNDPFVLHFVKKYNAIISKNLHLSEFQYISSFEKIILSPSSFSWWAAFLSEAKEIYFPITKEGVWSEKKGVDLKVDEERYKYIQVNSKYVPNFAEKFYNFKRINLHKVRLFINDIKKNIFLNKKIYPAFVINLKKYEDRRKNIEKEFQKIDQIPTFIEALNGHDKNFPFPKYKSLFYFFWGNKQSFKPGAFACYLSHAKVWEKVILQKETAALILEDDVRINKENYAKFINEKLPEDFDVIFLNNRLTAWLGFIPKRKEQLPSFTKVSKELINILLNNGYPNNLIPSGTDAYLISKKGAKKLLQMMQEKKICMGVDCAIIFNSLSKSDLEDINFIQKDKIPQTLLFFLETELNTPLGKTKINLESYIYTKGPVFSTTDFSSTIMHEVFINNSVFEKMTDNQ